MKPKNVMLLGFINRAVEYLDSHFDEQPDPRIAELKNIDLASLRDELADNLDVSLGTMQSTMTTLLKAGNEAFDQFVEDSKGKLTIADEFDKMFDVDLDGAKKNKQQQLAKLLSFYNLDSDFENVEDSNFDNEIDSEQYLSSDDSNEDDKYIKQIISNIGTDIDTKDYSNNTQNLGDTSELDDVFSEIIGNEKENKNSSNAKKEKTNVVKKDAPKYVNSLINELKGQIKKEEVVHKENEKDNTEVYERISKLYPYLRMGFIKVVYGLKGPISLEYPVDKRIIVLHRVAFKEVDNLRKFVEICLNHDYQINADEDKMIVDVFKEFVNGDGKILANIYEIANQGCLLGGDYEGYNVIINEED